MFYALQNKSIEEVNVTRVLLDAHEVLAKQNLELRKRIKIFSVSSCVTRLYAIYENFIETAISDYLDTLSECVPFSSLSSEFKTEYRLGISTILSKIDQGRYENLNHENIIKWYYEALSGESHYQFVTHALIRHEQNFRLNIVENLLAKIQLKELRNWLTNHPAIKSLYADNTGIYEQLEAEIKNFVQLRNDAAHGSLDDLEGKENLSRFCDLISSLIIAIGSFFRKSILLHLQNSGKLNEIGIVTESFGKNGAFVAKIRIGTKLKVGSNYYLLDNVNCYRQSIQSLMLNNQRIGSIISKVDSLEVGIKSIEVVKKKTRLFIDGST